MANSSFKDRWLPLIVFPTLLALIVKFMVAPTDPLTLADMLLKQCDPTAGNATPNLLEYTRVKSVDTGICMIVSTFHESMNYPLANTYLFYLLSTGSILVILPAMEGARMRRSSSIAYPSAWLMLSQIISIAATTPLYWMTFILSGNARPSTRENKKISQANAEAITFATAIGAAVPTFALLYLRDPGVTAAWQIYPIFFAFAQTTHLLVRRPSSVSQSGYSIIQLLLILSFIVSSSFHISVALPIFMDDPSQFRTAFIPSFIGSASIGPKMLEFLKCDFTFGMVATGLGTLWFSRSIRQLVGLVAWYLAATPLVGPGAAVAAVALWRESTLQ